VKKIAAPIYRNNTVEVANMENPKKVMVSGCFDLLHAGHIAFLQEASGYGDLYVCAGADANIRNLKGHEPMFSEQERVFVLNSLGCVKQAKVSGGEGMLDFLPDLDEIKPDFFVVNHDGHGVDKQAACEERGIEYRILERIPAENFPARSSTDAKSALAMPYRLCLTGGWLDQPWVNDLAPGGVITIQMEPFMQFIDRSGMATSTRKTAEKIWGKRVPGGRPETVAELLFACENPPGTKYVSGSQDALGITCPGINLLEYENGEFWPHNVDRLDDPDIMAWLQSVIHFVEIGPRPDGYDPLIEKNLSKEGAQRLADATRTAWQGIQRKDVHALAKGVHETCEAWRMLLPNTVPDHVQAVREKYKDQTLGTSTSGCGGGYLLAISETPPEKSFPLYFKGARY